MGASDLKALIRSLVVLVIQHAPTKGFAIQHIALPTIAFHTQIYNLLVFHFTQIDIVYSQQALVLHISNDHSHFAHFQNERWVQFNYASVFAASITLCNTQAAIEMRVMFFDKVVDGIPVFHIQEQGIGKTSC